MPANLDWSDETPIALADAAQRLGRSLRSLQRDADSDLIPVWVDPLVRRGKVTSMAAIGRARASNAAKAEAEFAQRQAMKRRRASRH